MTGSDEAADCIACTPGKYGAAGANNASSCISCIAGQAASAAGSVACVSCSLNSGTQNQEGATNCSCNNGFERVAAQCVRSPTSGLPTIVIENLTNPSKVSPTSPLVIQASILLAGTIITDVSLQWSLWSNSTAANGFILAPELLLPGALDSGLDGENLVVRAGVLSPGGTYRVRLRASTSMSIGNPGAIVEQEMTFSVNLPPTAGSLRVSPWTGTALNESFAISAAAFVDDDLPLTYRFGYQMTNRAITVMVSSTVDILFFQLGGNVKEVCETTTTYNI